jgi:ankyrin repeat protein
MDISLIEDLTQDLQDMILMYLSSDDINMIGKDRVSEYVWDRKKDKTVEEAAKNGNLVGLKYLLEKYKGDLYDITDALGMASKNGHINIVKLLVKECNADIYTKTLRIKLNYFEANKYFIKNGRNNERTLMVSSMYGCLETVKYLVEKRRADIHINNDLPLRISTEYGNFEIVKYLVDHGADVNAFDDYSFEEFSPLISSVENGDLEMVKYLVEHGVDIYIVNMALQFSARNGNLEIVKYLIDHGANVNTKYDCTLEDSAKNGHLNVIRYIVENCNVPNTYIDEILRTSAKYGKFEIVKYLVGIGANIHADRSEFREDHIDDGYNALELATQNGHLVIAEYLRGRGIDIHNSKELDTSQTLTI